MLADHNPVDFLNAFVHQYSGLRPLIEHCTRTETACTKCTHANLHVYAHVATVSFSLEGDKSFGKLQEVC